MGNRDDWDAPHGAYRCEGGDRWVAIAVTNDEEWQALCRVIDRLDLASDARLAGASGRREHQDELDDAITAWTSARRDYKAMRLLQEEGVPAGPSLDISRVYQDPQLREAGYLGKLQTSDGQYVDLPGLPWRIDGERAQRFEAAPVLGQHNEYVYRDLLGLSEEEIARLADDQVIY